MAPQKKVPTRGSYTKPQESLWRIWLDGLAAALEQLRVPVLETKLRMSKFWSKRREALEFPLLAFALLVLGRPYDSIFLLWATLQVRPQRDAPQLE